MKPLYTLCFLLLGIVSASAQSIESIKANRQNYIWGEGKGTTLRKADNEALAMIINQISVEIESDFTLLREENSGNYSETVKSVVNTYSNASLSNTERIVINNEPNAHVFRYIKRSEINKIFEARK